ncbi:hypothetical protein ACOSP7_012124 [Xanthoceras sorbifolium]
MFRRNVVSSDRCSFCGRGSESADHAIWGCKLVQPCWSSCLYFDALKAFKVVDFFDKLDFTVATNKSTLQPSASSSARLWKPYAFGFKLNVNAVLNLHDNFFGVGVVVRNVAGSPVFMASKFFENSFDVEVAEAFAMFTRMVFVADKRFLPCVVETDSLNVSKLYGGLISSKGDISNIVTDIKFLFDSHDFTSLSFVPRSCNLAAHTAAKWAMSHKQSSSWLFA